jgi:hypothetical protein
MKEKSMFSEQLTKVANKLVAYCREGNEQQGLKELYSADAVSVEAAAMPGSPSPEMKGLEAIKGKHEWWFSNNTVHSQKVEGPFFHGADKFGVIFDIDVSNKETKERQKMRELGVYTVKNGKIAREEFFYGV